MTRQTVVITGASKGIGRATALHLAARGWHVFAGVRKAEDGDALCADAEGRITPLLLDVTSADQIVAARERVTAELGSGELGALVNNAGMVATAPLEYLPIDALRTQLEVNVTGQLAMTQAFLPLLRRSRGRIVNISSVGGCISSVMIGAYHMSKFALEAMSDTLRIELRESGVRIITIEPGNIVTPIWENSSGVIDRLLQTDDGRIKAHYGRAIERLRARAVEAMKDGLPPERVAAVIERALVVPNPRPRYLVGMDAQIAGSIIARLPDTWRDALLHRLYM